MIRNSPSPLYLDLLHQEIVDSGIGSGFSGITTASGAATIDFAFTVDPTDAELDAILAAHPVLAGKPSAVNPARILGLYEGPTKPYWAINYVTALSVGGVKIRLHPERTFVLGELTGALWYLEPPVDANGNPTANRTPIVEYQAAYTRPGVSAGDMRASYRTSKRRWALEDGSWGPWHDRDPKYYLGVDITRELRQRADNCIAAQNSVGMDAIVAWRVAAGDDPSTIPATALGYANEWRTYFQDSEREFRSTNTRVLFDAIAALAPPTLQWAHDCPGFLAAVQAEVNLGGWS